MESEMVAFGIFLMVASFAIGSFKVDDNTLVIDRCPNLFRIAAFIGSTITTMGIIMIFF